MATHISRRVTCLRPAQGVRGAGKSAVVAMLSGAGPGFSAGQGTDIVDLEAGAVSIRLVDLPGQEHSHAQWESAMQGCHAAVRAALRPTVPLSHARLKVTANRSGGGAPRCTWWTAGTALAWSRRGTC